MVLQFYKGPITCTISDAGITCKPTRTKTTVTKTKVTKPRGEKAESTPKATTSKTTKTPVKTTTKTEAKPTVTLEPLRKRTAPKVVQFPKTKVTKRN